MQIREYVFDCLPHDIFIAKLYACWFNMKALGFIYDYFRNHKQRIKTDNVYSSWQIILYGVPQGPILGSLLFNIELRDLFLIMNHEDISSYADDNMLCVSGKNAAKIVRFSEKSSVLFSNCLVIKSNQFQANASKCHVLLSTDQHVQVNIGAEKTENSSSENLLGVTIDTKIKF